MKLTAIVRTEGACDHYRAVQPFESIKATSGIDTTILRQSGRPESLQKALGADVMLLPRVANEEWLKIMSDWKNIGKKVVVDFDDDIFNVSPWSPHYEDHGLESYTSYKNGIERKLWVDGENLDIKQNRKSLDIIKKALGLADMVTTTTPILAEVYKQYSDNVVVLPYCIDLDLWKPMDLKSNDEIRLFWAGGSSHYEDWEMMYDVIPAILDKYPQVKLVFMGMWDGVFKNIDPSRIERHKWVHMSAYPYKVASLNPTIGMIPLVDNEFNRAKSPIKWLEMASLEVPCVSSLVSPYKEIGTPHNGIFIENNSVNGWIQGLSLLIEDSILRSKMGGYAKRYVENHFDCKKNAHLWSDAYETLIDKPIPEKFAKVGTYGW